VKKNLFYLFFILSNLFIIQKTSYSENQQNLFDASRKVIDELSEQIETYTLDNGITFIFKKRSIAPVFSAVTTVGVGGVDEVKGETGISHMFEHMAFKGSKILGGPGKDKVEQEQELLAQLEKLAEIDPTFAKLDSNQKQQLTNIQNELAKINQVDKFSQEFEKRGSVGLNAGTDKDQTTYYVSMPKSEFEFWAAAESERLISPVMRQFYKERDVVLEERRMRFSDSPEGSLYEELLQKAYPNHPYGLPLIGFEQDIRNLTAKKLELFKDKYYLGSNIVIALVGDIDTLKDIKIIDKYFGRIPYKKFYRPVIPEPEPINGQIEFVTKKRAKPQLMIAYQKPNAPSQDDVALTIAIDMLNGTSLAPLKHKLVKEKRIALYVSAEEAPGNRFKNLIIFSLAPSTGIENKYLLKEFDELIADSILNFNEEQLVASKRRIAKSYIISLQGNMQLATLLSNIQSQHGDWKEVFKWYDQALEVSLEEVKKESQKYLLTNNRVIGFLEELE
jgi:predicted Zn-dependent peptidase